MQLEDKYEYIIITIITTITTCIFFNTKPLLTFSVTTDKAYEME